MTQESVHGRRGRKDGFSIELALTHPTFEPQRITEVLSAQPIYCWKSGDQIANLVKRSTYWYGRLSNGSTPNDFADALEGIALLLKNNEAFFAEFRRGNGEVELVLNHGVEQMEGKIFELHLHPAFLRQLAATGIGLRLQGWRGDLG